MGLIPHLFEKLKLNNNKKRPHRHSKSSNTLEKHQNSLYKKSIIVNDIVPKTLGEDFTFINKSEIKFNN